MKDMVTEIMTDEDLEMLEQFGIDVDKLTAPEAMFRMHLFNIITGVIMLVIGILLLCRSRKQRENSGKKIAGWILVGLGVTVTITHTIQMILSV